MGILLGSGWIGTTCLDEWQIGILGLAGGFTLFLTGSGYYSFDHFFKKKGYAFTGKNWFPWLGSGDIPFARMKGFIFVFSMAIFVLALFINQVIIRGFCCSLVQSTVVTLFVCN